MLAAFFLGAVFPFWNRSSLPTKIFRHFDFPEDDNRVVAELRTLLYVGSFEMLF